MNHYKNIKNVKKILVIINTVSLGKLSLVGGLQIWDFVDLKIDSTKVSSKASLWEKLESI